MNESDRSVQATGPWNDEPPAAWWELLLGRLLVWRYTPAMSMHQAEKLVAGVQLLEESK